MKILIPVIVGAIIGYFTNWLAIKMLFRPHYEKRLLGIKIPFTPGLIPKERKRIAESIGQAIGKYLLSPDTIIESLSNQGVGKKIQGWIEEKIYSIKNSQRTIRELLESIIDDYNSIIYSTKRNIGNFILNNIRKEEFINEIITLFQRKIDNIDPNKVYDLVENQLKAIIGDLSKSNELRDGIETFIKDKIETLSHDGRTLAEILGPEVQESISKYIDENKESIGQSIKKLYKEASIQSKIKNFISSLVTESISKVFFAFISPDFIVEKILAAIEKYVNNDKSNEDIIIALKTLLDRLISSKASDLIPNLANSLGDETISKIAHKAIELLSSPKTTNLLYEFIRKNLEANEKENKEKLSNYLDKNIRLILNSEEIENSIYTFISNSIEEALDKSVSSIVVKIDNASLEKTYKTIAKVFHVFLEKEFAQIVEFFNIEQIVIDKLNSFEIDFLEELILEIAEKELKAITWLGGLLGAILGLLSPLLQMIY